MIQQSGNNIVWIAANWPAPANIHAGVTTRYGGYSTGPYTALNLATHVGDDVDTVNRNRTLLRKHLQISSEPHWLEQVHGSRVIKISDESQPQPADGSFTSKKNTVCAVLTADCLPLLLCDLEGREIAAIHIGWRGYGAGIINSALSVFTTSPVKLLAWIGPYISACCYEVGEPVKQTCLNAGGTETAFTPGRSGHWYADLGLLVKQSLLDLGINHIYESGLCTCCEPDLFYSYRRDGITGRQASLLWMD